MKTRAFVRLIVLLLALCMLVTVFASCATDDEGATDNATNPSATGEDEELDLGITLGREVQILYSDYLKSLEAVEENEIGESVISKSIYDRWQLVQDELQVEVKWVPEPGKWDGTASKFIQKVKVNSENGSAFDAIICYNLLPGALANQGLLQNLMDSDYIDLDNPWWPQAYVEESVVNDILYGAVENSSYSNMTHLHGVFFNNDLIDAHNLTSPYEYVYNDTWTFDNMMALIKDIGYDMNNNGTKDAGDYFGLATGTQAKIETWFIGMGYRYSQKTATGEIELLINDQDKMIEWIDRFNAATAGKDFLIYDPSHTTIFFDNRAILYMTSLVMVNKMISDEIQMNYGVVPVPKGSESQERYLSNVANHHTAWCVPIECYNFQESTAVIEYMAYASYKEIAPVYFDTCVKLRYAPDERLYEMYDMIRDSITFDFCQTYSFVFDDKKDPRQLITNCTAGTTGWASQWKAEGANFENKFDSILALYGLAS